MLADSFKFKGHECFRDEWSGLDEFKPITVIIGRNNTGKSQLLDVLERLATSEDCALQLPYRCNGVLDEDSLLSVFLENTRGGDLPGHGGHWHDHGRYFVEQGIISQRDLNNLLKEFKEHNKKLEQMYKL